MNREILFKAKRIDNIEWVEGNLLQTTAVSLKSFIVPTSCYTFDKWDWAECLQVDTDTICQYTGLTDKDGNKIWENDIVTVPRDEEPCLIVWDEYCARWGMTQYGSYMYDFDNFDGVELEVLGNIFDNPELLEGGAEE